MLKNKIANLADVIAYAIIIITNFFEFYPNLFW